MHQIYQTLVQCGFRLLIAKRTLKIWPIQINKVFAQSRPTKEASVDRTQETEDSKCLTQCWADTIKWRSAGHPPLRMLSPWVRVRASTKKLVHPRTEHLLPYVSSNCKSRMSEKFTVTNLLWKKKPCSLRSTKNQTNPSWFRIKKSSVWQ